MRKVKLYTTLEYGRLCTDYNNVTEFIFELLINKYITVDMIPTELRIKNKCFYIGAHRASCYLKDEKDFLNYYNMLKCLHEDIDKALERDIFTERLQRLFEDFKDEAFSKERLKKYVMDKAKKDGEMYLLFRSD